jgi:hypothetical protein
VDVYLDSTSNNNDGDDFVTSIGKEGKIGNGQQFDGINDFIDAGAAASLADLGPMTISAWIKPITAGGGGAGKILAKYVTATTGRWMFEIDNTAPEVNAFEFNKDYDTTDIARVVNNGAVTYDVWQHMVVTWDGSDTAANIHIYKNGEEQTYSITQDGSVAQVSDAALPLIIGAKGDGTNYFDGFIDEARISNNVRTSNWITTEYNNQSDASGTQSIGPQTLTPYPFIESGAIPSMIMYTAPRVGAVPWTPQIST